MGQLLRVVGHVRLSDDVLRIEVDRSLTGMGLEAYESRPTDQDGSDDPGSPETADATSAELARRLLDCNQVSSVSVFSNVVTVVFNSPVEGFPDDMKAAVENLFTHYLPGVEPTPI